jgi:hypothetical protein
MTDDAFEEGDELTLAERAENDRKFADVQQMIRDHVDAGWNWDSSKNMLTHADDSEVNMWIHPYTHEVLYSPKLVELLKQQVERESKGGR